MGYQDSDILLFFGTVIVIIIIYVMKNKQSSSPPNTRSAPPESQTHNIPGTQRNVSAPMPPVSPSSNTVRSFSNTLGGEIKGAFVFVTSPEPQTQLMAMSLSTQILAKGKSLRVLLCGPGGDIALKDGREVILAPINKSPQMLLKNLIQNGVVVELCPFYLPNKGASESDIIPGITIAKPPVVAENLLESGVKLFTF